MPIRDNQIIQLFLKNADAKKSVISVICSLNGLWDSGVRRGQPCAIDVGWHGLPSVNVCAPVVSG